MSSNPVTDARVWYSPLIESDRYLPEGPRAVTVLGEDGVLWVNIQTSAEATTGELLFHAWDGGGVHRFKMPGRPGFALPTDRPDVAFVGCEKMLGTFHFKTQQWTRFGAIPDENPRTIINDGEVVPGGRAIVFGTKDVRFADPIAQLYLFTLDDHRLTVLSNHQTCSNGKVFAGSGRVLQLYDIDTPRKVVTRYRLDLDHRRLADEGIAIDLRDRTDFPDGMCDGGDGTVIIGFYNPAVADAGEACRYRLSDGQLVETWRTPGSPRVTCPLLVKRPDGIRVLLTTATEGMPDEMRAKCPEAGSLFLGATNLKELPKGEVVKL